MSLTNKYFSNVSNFEKITEAVRTASRLPDKIDVNILRQLGYTEPADALILRFFKELNFLTEDNSPTDLFERFRDPSQSKEAFSEGILVAYGDLFKEDPTIHLQSEEKITKLFELKVGDEKSNIIIGYMVKTFQVLIDYAGLENINMALESMEAQDTNSKLVTDASKASALVQATMSNGNGTATIVEKKPQVSSDKFSDMPDEERGTGNIQRVSNPATGNEFVNKAYIKKASLLYKLDRYEEAIPALDQVYYRFSDSDDSELYEQASEALVKKMDSAEKLDLKDELLAVYSEVITRLKDSEEAKFIEHTDHAHIKASEMLLAKDRKDEALEVLDQAIKRFKYSQRKPEFLAKAMYTKADLLELMGSDQMALEAIEDFLNNFG